MKYLDNVVKEYSGQVSNILTAIVCAYIFPDRFEITVFIVLSLFLLFWGIYIYEKFKLSTVIVDGHKKSNWIVVLATQPLFSQKALFLTTASDKWTKSKPIIYFIHSDSFGYITDILATNTYGLHEFRTLRTWCQIHQWSQPCTLVAVNPLNLLVHHFSFLAHMIFGCLS